MTLGFDPLPQTKLIFCTPEQAGFVSRVLAGLEVVC